VRLVTGTTATAAATAAAAARKSAGGGGAAARTGSSKDGQLDRSFLAGALGAGNLLLLVDYDLFKVLVAVFADVFVNGHVRSSTISGINYSKLESGAQGP
jgi:hypothetical protein